jgi:acyl-CoA thioesterase-2
MDGPPPDVASALALEPEGPNLFRSLHNITNAGGVIFGGQLLGQSLHAAIKTAPDRPVHSLHAYFIARGNVSSPVNYRVNVTNDGRSFSACRVSALQNEKIIFDMACSFHAPEPGFEHADTPVLSPPDPESLPVRPDLFLYPQVEFRPGEDLLNPSKTASTVGMWMRVPTASDLSPALKSCALAYISDAWLVSGILMRHAPAASLQTLQIASIDYSIWFHTPVQPQDWLYCEMDSPWAGGSRGLARGQFFDRAGNLIASMAQEVLIRGTANSGRRS